MRLLRTQRNPPIATLVFGLLIAVAGCAAPVPGSDAIEAEPVAATSPAPQPIAIAPTETAPRPAPPMSDPLPPVRKPDPATPRAPASVPAGQPVVIDTSCGRDADCTIRNVGNCCGEYPACVNVDSPTDPAAVQAQCAQSGTMSVCGFPSISACRCVAGECKGDDAAVVQ
jgi:hypothetical protein